MTSAATLSESNDIRPGKGSLPNGFLGYAAQARGVLYCHFRRALEGMSCSQLSGQRIYFRDDGIHPSAARFHQRLPLNQFIQDVLPQSPVSIPGARSRRVKFSVPNEAAA